MVPHGYYGRLYLRSYLREFIRKCGYDGSVYWKAVNEGINRSIRLYQSCCEYDRALYNMSHVKVSFSRLFHVPITKQGQPVKTAPDLLHYPAEDCVDNGDDGRHCNYGIYN